MGWGLRMARCAECGNDYAEGVLLHRCDDQPSTIESLRAALRKAEAQREQAERWLDATLERCNGHLESLNAERGRREELEREVARLKGEA